MILVSIPFKREGVSEQTYNRSGAPFGAPVSIPFKRDGVSERLDRQTEETLHELAFLFPSSGKAFPNTRSLLVS